MGFSISGLGSGLDTASLVSQLMQAERLPQTKVTARQQVAQKQVTAWNELRTKMQAVQTAAEALRTPSKALGALATSSDPVVLKATATADATPATYTLKVLQVAAAQQQTLSGLGAPSSLVGAGRTTVTTGTLAPSLQFGVADAGPHTVEVLTSSSAPVLTGTAAPALSYPAVLLQPAPSVSLSIDGGAPRSLALKASYVDAADLAADLTSKLAGAATVTAVNGRLQVTQPGEGATRSLTFSGSTVAALGLTTATVTGQAAVVSVDGTTSTVEPATSGTRSAALGASGITMDVGTTLRVGGSARAVVAVTDDTSTLADLQSMLNASGSPVNAALVTGDAGTSLVMTASATGSAGDFVVTGGTSAVNPATATTTASRQAQVQVNGATVTRSSNSLSGVVPGVTFDLLSMPTDGLARTVTVARDSTATNDKAKALVDSLNTLLGAVATSTAYDVRGGKGGPLVGDSTARSLASSLFSAAATTLPSGSMKALSQLGIQATRDGRFTLDAAALTKALAADPDGVAGVLSGFADTLATSAKSASETGGLLTNRRDGAQSEVDARQRQFDAMDVRLAQTQARYKAQFSKLEAAMASLTSQSSSLGAALSGLNRTP